MVIEEVIQTVLKKYHQSEICRGVLSFLAVFRPFRAPEIFTSIERLSFYYFIIWMLLIPVPNRELGSFEPA